MLVFGPSLLVILGACASAALAAATEKLMFDLDNEAQLVELFNNFKQKYEKNYHKLEHSKRYQIFVENLAEINAMNEQDSTATYGINEFTDMTTEEFLASHTGYIRDTSFVPPVVMNATEVPDIEIPKQFDWRDKNVVTSVKAQSVKNTTGCGSCWAFSVVGNIEGQYAMKYKELVDFSPQQLVSCDKGVRNNGCDGGIPFMAMEYLIKVGGLETDKDYPYTSGRGDRGICKFDKKKIKVTLKSYNEFDFSTMTEDEVAKLLVSTGPLTVGLAGTTLKAYKGGILSNEGCKDTNNNHAVLIVGYGEENGIPYWLFKNSWGTDSGEKGYFRLQRGVNCLNFMDDYGVSALLK